ncbi:YhdP family protein [Methylomagnum sp.]
MKTLLHLARRAALHAFLAALVALALSLSVLRLWLLPKVAEFRAPLAAQIGTLIGETVRIDALSAHLRGFHPEIFIEGLHILDPQGRSAIRFATVRLNLDTFRSLAAGEPRFNRIEVVGPKLSIRRKPDGTLAVIGLTIAEKPPAWLLAGGDIGLLDAEVDWQDLRTGTPPLPLGRINLWLRNTRHRHRLSADFALPDGLGQSLRLALDARGDLFEPTGWRGTIYLEGHGLDAARLTSVLPAARLGLRAGAADARIWLNWQGAWRSVAGDVSLTAPLFEHRPDQHTEHPLALHSLATRFFWENRPDGWRLDLTGFRPALHDPWPDSRLAVAVSRRPDGALSSLSAAASHLDLGDVGSALNSLALLDGDTRAALRALAPHGSLGDARLFYSPGAPMGERLALCGQFRDLAAHAWQTVPGFSGLGGNACGTDGAGHATLSVRPGHLNLAALGLRRPIPLTELRAELAWRQTKSDWRLAWPSVSARNAELALQGQGRLALSKAVNAPPYVDLEARLTGVDVAAVRHYIPSALVPDAARWADGALNAGRISRADILFKGFAADFPFGKGEGLFRAELDTEDLRLTFNPDWLPVTQTRLHALFQSASVTLDARQGRIGAGQIVEAHGNIDNLLANNPWLRITGRVRTGVADALEFLAHSPLRKIPERLGKDASASGEADVALKLAVPLNSKLGQTSAEGTANFRRAGLKISALDLALSHIEGPLHFNGEGFRSDAIRAKLLGQPAVIGVKSEAGEIRIGVQGKASVATLGQTFPADLWHWAKGAADYRLDLALPETLDAQNVPVRLALASDLVGIALDLPAPLGKPASETRALTIETSLQAGRETPVQLTYGPDLKARLRLLDGPEGLRLSGGDIAFAQPLPATGRMMPGLGFAARLDGLDAGAWRRWWNENPAGGAGAGLLREVHWRIGKLAWNGADFGRFAGDAERRESAWRGRIDGDYLQGEFTATADSIRADLDRLKLPTAPARPNPPQPSASATPPVGPDDAGDIDPASVPSLRLRAKRLLWKNADLGPLELDTERRAHGMVIKTLGVKTKAHQLDLRGHWTHAPNRSASTHLEGKLHIASLGEFLAAIGKGGDVRDTPTDSQFSLDWPGAPHRYAAATVTGEVKLALGKGGLLNVEPGLGRVIGMLNLQSLWRRLSLDFSDMFGKGLAYDGVAGTFRLGGSQAITEGFLIDAVSARIIIGGRAGLVAKDLDQSVAVIPRTSVALPIAGALAGGPAVGAALLLAQQLVGEEVDSIATTHYAVQGSWDNPTITRIHHNHMPLDVLDQAWSGVKNLSGFAGQQEEQKK